MLPPTPLPVPCITTAPYPRCRRPAQAVTGPQAQPPPGRPITRNRRTVSSWPEPPSSPGTVASSNTPMPIPVSPAGPSKNCKLRQYAPVGRRMHGLCQAASAVPSYRTGQAAQLRHDGLAAEILDPLVQLAGLGRASVYRLGQLMADPAEALRESSHALGRR